MPHGDTRPRRTVPPHTLRPWPLPRVRSERIEALRAALGGSADPVDSDHPDAPAGPGPEPGGRVAEEGATEQFRDELRRSGTPIVEPDDPGWCRLTFVWMGEAPHGVVLQLNRLADPLDPADTLLERVAGSDVHALTLRLPDTYLESYFFVPLPGPVAPTLHGAVDRRVLGGAARAAAADPCARESLPSKPTMASARMAQPAHAVARGPEGPLLALWRDEPEPTRQLGPVVSPANGEPLALHRYSVPGADAASPVVLLLDGEVWRTQYPIARELARRVDAGRMAPVHVLFLESGGPIQREGDYASSPALSQALLQAVRDASAGTVPDTPWIVAGQSLGGLAACLWATRHPAWVRAAIGQSPSLWWPTPLSPWEYTPGWFEERAAGGGAPVLLQAGAIDAGIVERTRPAAALLRSQGGLIDYSEWTGGHDVLQWQAGLPDALARVLEAV